MLKDKDGNVLFRKLSIRIVFPEKIFPDRKMSKHAPVGRGFNDEGIASILESISDQLEKLYPFWDFTVVELSRQFREARYVVAFAGYRTLTPEQKARILATPDHHVSESQDTPAAESTTPAPEAAEGDTSAKLVETFTEATAALIAGKTEEAPDEQA